MTTPPTLTTHMKTLRLSGILDSLDVRLEQARSSSLGYLEFLALIIQDEVERREANKLNQRLKRAAFEEPKAIEDFDFSSLPGINIAAIKDLATVLFVTKKEHVILYGPPGVGKTHLAQALGNQACRTGYSTLFIKTAKLFRGLNAARADGTWEKALKKLLTPDVLIIDDFGLSAMTMTQAEEFYEIVAERHQRGSIIMTSNRPPGDWLSLFPDQVMANSAMDRLAHRAHHIAMKGESYRMKTRPKYQSPEH
nr:IS21-like element helper ATPase IstB [Rhodoferax sp.]